MTALLIQNGRILDPANRRDEVADLLIIDGRIAPISALKGLSTPPETLDASGLLVTPGLIDLHVHLREPVRTVVLELGRRLGVHVRALSGTSYCGEFYGQWTPGVAHHESISIDALESLIARLPSGTTELACHPGADAVEDVTTMCASERAVERETLCDVRARKAISDHDVVLRSFLPADSVVG